MGATVDWPTFSSQLEDRREVAQGTMAFHFSKPPDWTFEAGQFIDITLSHPPQTDAEGDKRGFSVASAPYEKRITIATRMRDTAFKRSLKVEPIGTTVTIEGPFGNLTLHQDADRPAVMLTGGIGITTFRSIVLQAAHLQLPHRMLLFYSNRRPEDAAFLDELEAVHTGYPAFTLVATMTDMNDSKRAWDGETGLIDARLLSKYTDETKNAVYYITGPPGMVRALQTMLAAAGVPNADVRVEEYTGY